MSDNETSPLKDRPLNVPGQSVDLALREFVDDHFLLPLSFLLALALATIWEWFAYLNHLPRHPEVISAVTLLAFVCAAVYWRRLWVRVKTLKLGRDGERAVGQFLEMYVESDAVIYHDVPTEKGNIDHVIICSRGIYTVETKTRTKPKRGTPLIVVDRDGLTVNGHKPDRNPITQAAACAADLKGVLRASTGKKFDVRPVVAFPGWYIEDRRGAGQLIWVLEPKALPAWIEKEPGSISPSDLSMASYHLSRYIRTHSYKGS